ncbi:redoxin domain-containing protein, partial [Frankia sp. CcWB2]
MNRLDNGQLFPKVQVPKVGGGSLCLPEDLAGHFGVVLIYRGSWCPYCNAQLAAFQRAGDALTDLDVRVAALSVDDEESGRRLVDKHRIDFPVGHSADVDGIAEATDAYINDESSGDPRRYLQSTGFVLAPNGSVITA